MNEQNEICIYADGSGKASEELEWNLKTISEWEEIHKLHRAFIEAHKDTLAGIHWRVAYLENMIELRHGSYRGKPITPAGVARLWPEAKWKRTEIKWSSSEGFHWEATVDGVVLRIVDAEIIRPVKPAGDGTAVDLDAT